jgi:hypothetical protein
MDFWKAILGLARRRLIVIPLLVTATVAALAGYFLTPLHYVSSTTMVLITPALGGTLSKDPTAPIGLTNPMLSFSNNLKTASSILIQVMNTPEVAAELGAGDGDPTELTVDDGRTNPHLLDGNGPFVYIAGESTSAAEAKDVVIRAQKRMRQELVDRQKSAGAPPETYLTIVDVVAPTTPEVNRSNRIKVGSVALVLSSVFGLSIAYAWQARRYRRAAAEVPPKHQDIELDQSSNWGHQELNKAAGESSWKLDIESQVSAEQRPADKERVAEMEHAAPTGEAVTDEDRAAKADPWAVPADAALRVGQLWIEEARPDTESQVSAEPHPADKARVAELEQAVVTGEAVTDEERAVEAEALAEPEEVDYPSQDREGWDLYIVEYPPAKGVGPPSSDHNELDWNWEFAIDSLESERDSEVVGRRRLGG